MPGSPSHARPGWAMWANVVAVPVLLAALGGAFVFARRGADVSEVENRKLAAMPALTWGAVYGGSYTRDVELYIADHFPLREPFMAAAFQLKTWRGVKDSTAFYEQGPTGGLDDAEQWARTSGDHDGGEGIDAGELAALEALSDWDGGEEEAPGGGEPGVEEPPALEEPAGGVEEPLDLGPTTVRAGVLIHGGRGMMLFSGTDDTARAFAKVANAYARAFRKQTVHVVVTPTATPFYIPDEERHRTRSEKDNLAVIRGALDGGQRFPDVYGALEPHAGESIFYLTDHHWTALGAWYGYAAFCASAGFTPVPLSAMEKKQRPPDVGSMYRMTRDPALKDVADVTEYYEPTVDSQAVRFTGDDQKTPVRARVIDERKRGYLVFLGGDWPVMLARTRADTHRRALVVKNSFGNAFTPFLLPHYEVLVVVDYRYTVRSVAELVRQYRVDDIILVMDTVTANYPLHQRRVREIIQGHDAAWTIGRGLLPDGGPREKLP